MVRKYHKRNKLIDGYLATEHPNYVIWNGIKGRCFNPNHPSYKAYGGKGITMCSSWDNSFEQFCKDMGVRPTPKHTVDRIENTLGYEPSNCRWATRTEQCLNRTVFTSNTTGYAGVKRLRNGRYKATYDNSGRYTVSGSFDTAELANAARLELIRRLRDGVDVSDLLDRPARFDSSTGIRGITKQHKGGFVVRVTDCGVRTYLGFTTTIEEAIKVLEEWKQSKKR
jgi:hypothetical protein